MQPKLARYALAALCVGVSSCSLDLEIPQLEKSGGLRGLVDTQGHIPAAELTIRLIHSESGERFELKTDTTGAFVKSDLSRGSYLVQAEVPGFSSIREGPFTVSTGKTLDVGTFSPTWLAQTPSEATLKGRVLVRGGSTGAATDAGQVLGAGSASTGRPSDAQGAKVECLLDGTNGTVISTAVVDAFGDFSARLPPGTYALRVTHPYYVAALRQQITVAEGESKDVSAQPLVLELNPAEVRGTVLREVDQQATGLPAEGALIVADTGVTALVDATGHFTLTNLAAGQRSWTITLSNHADPLPGRVTSLAAGEKHLAGAVTLLLQRGSITGEVEMADGSQLDQVTVSIPGTGYAAQVAASSTSPSKGRFVIDRLPVSSYNVKAARPSYIAATSTTVNVVAGAPVDVGTLKLTRVQGDFVIDDGDATNLGGYARQTNVTLQLTNVQNGAEYRKSESLATLAAEPWSAFSTPNIAHTLTSGDGLKTVYLQFRDSQNNESPPLQSSLFLDTTKPSNVTLELANGAAFTNRANPVPVTLSADEAGSGIASMHLSVAAASGVELPGPRQAWLRDSSFTRPALSDGGAPHEGLVVIYGQLIDNAGNVSDIVSDTAVVDTTNPTGSVTVLRGAAATLDGYTNSPFVDLSQTFNAEPFDGGLKVRLANDLVDLSASVMRPAKTRESWALDPLDDGVKTVHAQFVDSAGNVNAPAGAAIVLDRVAPQVTVTRTSSAITSNRTVSLQIASTDLSPLSPTQALTISESPLLSGATPSAMPSNGAATYEVSPGDGEKIIYVRVRDAAGNDTISDAARLRLKQTPPSGVGISLVGTLGDGAASSTLISSASVTVTLSHVGATQVRLGGASQTDCSTSGGYSVLTSNTISGFTLPGSGTARVITACFMDEAGNTAGPVQASIDLDAASPTGCALVLAGRRVDGTPATPALDKTALTAVGLSLSGCSETAAEVVFTEAASIDCTSQATLDWRPLLGTSALTLSSGDGAKTVRGCVRDGARNAASFSADVITLDSTPPLNASLTIDSGNAFLNASDIATRGGRFVSVQGAATGAVEWAIAEGSTPTTFQDIATNPATVTLSAGDGRHVVRALFRDELGNTTPLEATDDIEVDTQAPTLTSLTLSGTLADLTTSEAVTASTSVRASLIQAGADGVLFGTSALVTCPTTGYQSYSGGTVITTLPTTDATQTIAVCITDEAGNVAGPVTDSIDFDTASPIGCQLTLRGKDVSGATTTSPLDNLTAQREVGADVSGCSETPLEIYLTEAASVVCNPNTLFDWKTLAAASFTVSSGDTGKTVRGCVRDRARNVGSLASDGIVLDTTPPTSPTVSVDNGAEYLNAATKATRGNVNQVSVTGTATGALTWAIAEGTVPSTFTSYSTDNPRTLVFSAGEGVKTVRALFADALGNVTTLEATDSIEVDTIAPTVSAIEIIGKYANGQAATDVTAQLDVTVSVTHSGGTRLSMVDNAASCGVPPYASWSGGVSAYTLVGSGATRGARACVSDEAGNVAPSVTDTISYDGSPPAGCALVLVGYDAVGVATSGPLANLTARAEVSVTFAGCSETPTSVFLTEAASVTCNNTSLLDWRTFGTGFTHSLSSTDGSKTVRGCVRDAALNVSSLTADAISLDTTPPTAGARVELDTGATYVNASQVSTRGGYIASARATAPADALTWATSTSATAPTAGAYVTLATNNPRDVVFATAEGSQSVYAFFKDSLGNSTEAVTISDSIVFDTLPPATDAGVNLAVHGPTQNEFTNTESVVVKLNQSPVDATGLQLTQAASAAACIDTDFGSAASFLIVPSYTFTLSPTEEAKRVCVKLFDAAGNPSTVISDAVTLDKTAPTTPQITTLEQYVSAGDDAGFTVSTASPSIEPAASFDRYELLGGKTAVWTTASTVQSSTSFVFHLSNPVPLAEDGIRNELRLRAVDKAGNTSGESVVFVTADTNPPDAIPAIQDQWIDNGNGRASIYWQPSPSGAAGYQVFYGSSSTVLNGNYANQGTSPVTVGGTQNFISLTGLPNFVPTYVRIAPFDLAGNVGPTTPSGTSTKMLQPGEVSPNLAASLTLVGNPGTSQNMMRNAIYGHHLYVLTETRPYGSSECADFDGNFCQTVFTVVDMNGLTPGIKANTINADAGVPTQLTSATRIYSNDNLITRNGEATSDMLIDGNWLFMASGKFIRIFSLKNPASPNMVAEIDVSIANSANRVNAVPALIANKLILTGRRTGDSDSSPSSLVVVLDVSKLFDALNTKPTDADLTIFEHVWNHGGSMVTRDRLLLGHNGSTFNQVVRLGDVLDTDPFTVLDSSDFNAAMSPPGMNYTGARRGLISGNYLVTSPFRIVQLNPVWNTATSFVPADVIYSSGLSPGAELVGDQMVGTSGTTTVLDLNNLASIRTTASWVPPTTFSGSTTTTHSLIWGHYGIAMGAGGLPANGQTMVRFLELASPRTMTLKSVTPGANSDITLRPGMVYTNGGAFDLLTAATPAKITLAGGGGACARSTWADDVYIGANGTSLEIRDQEKWIDRDLATTPGGADGQVLALGATTRAYATQALGNYLVVAEHRLTGSAITGGVWLEVFDIRNLRDRLPTTLALGNRVAELQVQAHTLTPASPNASNPNIDLTLNAGVAAVSLDYSTLTVGPNVIFVNLNNVFDDDTTTTFSATQIQGTLQVPSATRTVVQGNYAYVSTRTGLNVFDVTPVMDGDDSVVLTGTPANGSLALTPMGSVVVYGATAYLAPNTGGDAVYAVDVSTPLSPTMLSSYPFSAGNSQCSLAGDSYARFMRGQLVVGGTRVYVADHVRNLRVLELE